jgi:hypothetical protein
LAPTVRFTLPIMKKANELSSAVGGLIEEGEAFNRLSSTRRDRASRDRRFYTGLAIAFLVTAVAGFAPSYHSKIVTQARPLGTLLHLHAFLFTAWLLLLLSQTALIARHRVDLHRRLGIGGAALATAMVPVGLMTALSAAQLRFASGHDPSGLLAIQAGAIVMFAAFVGGALWMRRRPELHRRLMLLGTVSIMPPAIARLPVVGGVPILALLLSTLFVLAGVIYDLRSRGRVHPAYVWGGLLILLSGPLRVLWGQTSSWQSFARFLLE